jgi:anthranilate/para-aminobenzoate synthase component I
MQARCRGLREHLDSCIAIRTIELRDGVATVEAGAGIVADRPRKSFRNA